jgi:hypothetical protein
MQSTYTQPATGSAHQLAQAFVATLAALLIIAAVAISLALGSGALSTSSHKVSSQTTPMVDRAPAFNRWLSVPWQPVNLAPVAAPAPVSVPDFGNGLRRK